MADYDKMKKPAKREISRQEDISQRTRTHALALLSRIYLTGNSVLLVRNEPDPVLLRQYLCDSAAHKTLCTPAPAQLGFANTDVIPLNRGGLASRSRSVQRWRNWIEKRMAGRTSAAELRELRAESAELESLGDRVAALHDLVCEKTTQPSPLWLEPAVEKRFQEMMRRRFAGLQLSGEVSDLARLVCWTGDLSAVSRFIESVRDGLLTFAQHQQRQAVERFHDTLVEIQRIRQSFVKEAEEVSLAEREAFHRRLDSEGVFRKLREAFAAIPPQFQNKSGMRLSETDEKINFQEIAQKSRKLFSELSSKLKKQLYPDKFNEIQNAISIFNQIVSRVNERINQIEADAESRKLSSLANFRAQAREQKIFDRLRNRFDAIPEMAKAPNRIFLPGREREIDIDLIQQRTHEVLKSMPDHPSAKSLRWLALFCLTDKSKFHFPWEAFAKRADSYELSELWQNRFEPGYEKVIESFGEINDDWGLDEAREFLATGVSLEELKWFTTHDVYRPYDARYGAAAKPFQVIVTWLQAQEAEFSKEEIDEFWKSIASETGCALIESLARFLAWLTRPTRQQVGEITGLIRTLSHPSLNRPLIDRLRSWANLPARPRLPIGCPKNLPVDITLEARRLAFYQRMAGQEARIPGSIRGILESRSRQMTEMEHLKSLGEGATPSQKSRMDYLSNRIIESDELDTRTSQRMLRQIREVTVLTAVSAAKQIIRNEIGRWWKSRVGAELDINSFSWKDQLKLISWIEKLDEKSKALVVTILQAHQQYGSAYLTWLPQNRGWLDKARQTIRLDAWLYPPAMRFEIDGKQVTLKAASQPVDIFLMGSRFETCLSLHNGCNSSSVIANASDCNKAVIYAWSSDGTPIARKLVGIRMDWKMVGFNVYAHKYSEEIDRAFDTYCGQWAARTGLGLANLGSPQVLSNGFWYNDGSTAWTDEACLAYREIKPDIVLEIDNQSESDLAQLHRALEMIQLKKAEGRVELEEIGRNWPAVAAYWSVRIDRESLEKRAFSNYARDSSRTLSYHLAASGLTHKLPVPHKLNLNPEQVHSYSSELAWSVMALVPPNRDDISRVHEFLMHLPGNPESFGSSACFATCRISPVFGLLPFRKTIRLLGRYSDFFRDLDCGCNADAWNNWAEVLRLAWEQQPDPAGFSEAFADIGKVISKVMEQFCWICPDRRFSGPIRRKLRSNTEMTKQAALHELRSKIQAIDQASLVDQDGSTQKSVIFDRDLSFEDRLEALVNHINHSGQIDEMLGALLCAEWTVSELTRLPLEIRSEFARKMLDQSRFDEWKAWPLLF